MHGRFRRRLSAFGDVFGYYAAACGELWLKPRACRFCVFCAVFGSSAAALASKCLSLAPAGSPLLALFSAPLLQLVASCCSSLSPAGSVVLAELSGDICQVCDKINQFAETFVKFAAKADRLAETLVKFATKSDKLTRTFVKFAITFGKFAGIFASSQRKLTN